MDRSARLEHDASAGSWGDPADLATIEEDGSDGGYMWWKKNETQQQPLPVVNKPKPPGEEFLEAIVSAKARADVEVESARRQHEADLRNRFEDDVRFKERLTKFAQENDLDDALVALWEEVHNYAACAAARKDQEWNRLRITDPVDSSTDRLRQVQFTYDGHRFCVTRKDWSGEDGDSYADFALLEDGEEMFAISCSENIDEYLSTYTSNSVSAFKKKGSWGTTLLRFYAEIRKGRDKRGNFRYFGAENIKNRFQE